jgi:glycosyltransferase involved in cell wall biosynthesis
VTSVLFIDQAGVLGGGELYLLDVARAFRESCKVVTFEPGPFVDGLAERRIAVEVVPAPRSVRSVKKQTGRLAALGSLAGVVRLANRVARIARPFDLLYANSQKALIVASIVARRLHKPLIWNLHDILTAQHFSRHNRKAAIAAANRTAARVIVNSASTEEAYVQSGGRVETAIVYNGIDAVPFLHAVRESRRMRDELGLGTEPVVGVFSRISEWKGQHVLIEALRELPGIHGLFVGGSLFDADGGYEHRLRRMCSEYGLDDRVHFCGFRRDIAEMMAACDIIAHTSTAAEPFGRVIVEGMLSRKPVIASAAGGALEILQDGQTGLLVPPSDSAALAAAISKLLTDTELAKRICELGFERARSVFSVENMAADIRREIDAVVAASSSTAAATYVE